MEQEKKNALENLIEWAKRVARRLSKFFARVAKGLLRWYRSRRPKKLSRKEKKRLQKLEGTPKHPAYIPQHPNCRHSIEPYTTIKAQKATDEQVRKALLPETPGVYVQVTEPIDEAVVAEMRKTRAITLADIPEVEAITLYDADPEAETWQGQLAKRKLELEKESLEAQLRDTKAILQVTKHTVRRKKLEKQVTDLETRLKEFQPLKNNI